MKVKSKHINGYYVWIVRVHNKENDLLFDEIFNSHKGALTFIYSQMFEYDYEEFDITLYKRFISLNPHNED